MERGTGPSIREACQGCATSRQASSLPVMGLKRKEDLGLSLFMLRG